MSVSTSQQYSRVYAALAMLKIDKQGKEELVCSYTKDPAKVSLKNLDFDQCSDLISKLNNMVSPGSAPAPRSKEPKSGISAAEKESCNKIRMKVFACCHNLGWYKADQDGRLILKDGKRQLDYARIDAFCMSHTGAAKPLKRMDKRELQSVAYQFDRMLTNYTTKSK